MFFKVEKLFKCFLIKCKIDILVLVLLRCVLCNINMFIYEESLIFKKVNEIKRS